MLDSIAVGSVLLGKYRVEGVIGEGGMGVVFLAFHLQLHEQVALKFPKRETLRLPGAAERFITEARAAIRIKSEHVARVIDVGSLEDGTPFIVMEYLAGETLRQYAAREAPVPTERIVEFITQVAEAIAEAHALGIVHRDLKPANIFLTRRADGVLAAKVLDFGISQLAGPAWEGLSGKDDIEQALGSPAYASPEQLQSPNNVDLRSDIWSLGVIMYELATGRLPFCADTTVALCGKVIFDPFVSLRIIRPDLPIELSEAIDRCLQKLPENRPSSIGQLVSDLLPLAPSRAIASIERVVRIVGNSANPTATLLPLVERNDSVIRRGLRTATGIFSRRSVRTVGLTAVVTVLIVVSITLGQRQRFAPPREISRATAAEIVVPPIIPSSPLQAHPVPPLPTGSGSATTRDVAPRIRKRAVPAPVTAPTVLPVLRAVTTTHNDEGYLDEPAYSNRK